MRHLPVAVVAAAASACIVPDLGNPFENPSGGLVIEPSALSPGVQDVEIRDESRRTDFRSVFEVDAYGDFYVRDWSSSTDTVFVELDVLDDAFGEQDLVLTLDDGEQLSVTFEVR